MEGRGVQKSEGGGAVGGEEVRDAKRPDLVGSCMSQSGACSFFFVMGNRSMISSDLCLERPVWLPGAAANSGSPAGRCCNIVEMMVSWTLVLVVPASLKPRSGHSHSFRFQELNIIFEIGTSVSFSPPRVR